jgi:hypothetical protein
MLLWCLLLGYRGWRFMVGVKGSWGFTLFLIELACIALLMMLLSFLLYVGALDPSGLPHEVGRLTPWIRWSTVAVVLVTWTMAGTVAASHPALAALLALCGTAGGLKYTVFKAAIDRAAFPKPQ